MKLSTHPVPIVFNQHAFHSVINQKFHSISGARFKRVERHINNEKSVSFWGEGETSHQIINIRFPRWMLEKVDFSIILKFSLLYLERFKRSIEHQTINRRNECFANWLPFAWLFFVLTRQKGLDEMTESNRGQAKGNQTDMFFPHFHSFFSVCILLPVWCCSVSVDFPFTISPSNRRYQHSRIFAEVLLVNWIRFISEGIIIWLIKIKPCSLSCRRLYYNIFDELCEDYGLGCLCWINGSSIQVASINNPQLDTFGQSINGPKRIPFENPIDGFGFAPLKLANLHSQSMWNLSN